MVRVRLSSRKPCIPPIPDKARESVKPFLALIFSYKRRAWSSAYYTFPLSGSGMIWGLGRSQLR